jgi:hypothetical protein
LRGSKHLADLIEGVKFVDCARADEEREAGPPPDRKMLIHHA